MKNIMKAVGILIIALMLLAPLASTYPDGLEKVAESLEIVEPEPLWRGLMPDYTLTIIKNSYFATLISGFVGSLIVCSITWILGIIATRKTRKTENS